MKLPRNVSGDKFADHVCRRWDYVRVTQVGSYIMLSTETPSHSRQVVPAHHPIKIGTFSKILSQVASHKQVSREEILRGL